LWDFNQIVGWLRLYAWSGNIRAGLFFVREPITKIMREKTFDTRRGNFIEMYVFPKQSNEKILAKGRPFWQKRRRIYGYADAMLIRVFWTCWGLTSIGLA
jgi:hypothetical protein